MRKLTTIFVIGIAGVLLFIPTFSFAQTNLANRLAGKILLQVESSGEAWYVHPDTKKRHSLGRPSDAFKIMQEVSMGISNTDLTRLFGALPFGSQEIYSTANKALAQRLSGQILLQVEAHGEAYYINPDNLKGYYLARPADAFRVMRELGLGITNTDLADIPTTAESSSAEATEDLREHLVTLHSVNLGGRVFAINGPRINYTVNFKNNTQDTISNAYTKVSIKQGTTRKRGMTVLLCVRRIQNYYLRVFADIQGHLMFQTQHGGAALLQMALRKY